MKQSSVFPGSVALPCCSAGPNYVQETTCPPTRRKLLKNKEAGCLFIPVSEMAAAFLYCNYPFGLPLRPPSD